MKDLSRFLRLLTHDLQNQLGAVDLNLQVIPNLVQDTDPTMKLIEPFLSRASVAANDLAETLTDVQIFARLLKADDEITHGERTVIDLSSKVLDCGLIMAKAAQQREVEFRAEPGSNITALGISEDVRRALKILVTDALRTSFPGSKVALTCRHSDSGSPLVELTSNEEGLFDVSHPTLARFLAERLLDSSGVRLEYNPGEAPSPSRLRLHFEPALPI